MSNRLRRRPPESVTTYARAYRCHDCTSVVHRPVLDEHGVWHVPIAHDPWCPALSGVVSHTSAGLAAAAAVAARGHRVAYTGGPWS